MLSYIDRIAEAIRHEVEPDDPPAADTAPLFRLYAVLALAKGTRVTGADVHNAWAAWKLGLDPGHEFITPFTELSPATQAKDEPYVDAIHTVARRLGLP